MDAKDKQIAKLCYALRILVYIWIVGKSLQIIGLTLKFITG